MREASSSDRTIWWIALISGVLCLAGLAVSGYLTYAHYTSATVLACSDKGLVNCAKVTTSQYSRVLGIPVADAGVVYFIAMAGLCLPKAWRSSSPVLRYARLAGAVTGVGMVLWLVYAELFRLSSICLYCTAVHALTVFLFITVAFGTAVTGSNALYDRRAMEIARSG